MMITDSGFRLRKPESVFLLFWNREFPINKFEVKQLLLMIPKMVPSFPFSSFQPY
jgi:hypothetical protein